MARRLDAGMRGNGGPNQEPNTSHSHPTSPNPIPAAEKHETELAALEAELQDLIERNPAPGQ